MARRVSGFRVKAGIAAGIVTAFVAGMGFGPRLVQAAMTVFDPTVNASVLKSHAEAVKQLEELRKVHQTASEMQRATGTAGQVARGDYFAGGERLARAVTGLGNTFERWSLPDSQQPPADGSPARMQAFLQENTTLWRNPDDPPPSAADRQAVETRRHAAFETAAYNGLAIALAERNGISRATGELSQLAVEASNSVDLRNDIAVTNKLLISINEELIYQRHLLATLLEIEGSRAVRDTPATFGRVSLPALSHGAPGGSYRLGE